jgi:RNA polymerase sigma factor (sigma-70 family)
VFIALARKAGAVARHPSLLAWLHRSTRFAAVNVIRIETRRQRREAETDPITDMSDDPTANTDWNQLRPVLDTALHELSERDRQIVLMRFFDRQTFAQIGAALGLTENAAQKIVTRALDALHVALSRRGVTSTAAALGLALTGQAQITAPAYLAAKITSAALASATVAAGTGAGIGNFLQTMNATKLVAGIAVVCGAIGIGLTIHERNQAAATAVMLTAQAQERVQLQAQIRAQEARLAAAENRTKAAEDDNALPVGAVERLRTAREPAPVVDPTPKTKAELAALPREAALREVAAFVEKMELQIRSRAGYRQYQPPDESQFTEQQRNDLERARTAAKTKNKFLFVYVVDGKMAGQIHVPSLGDEPIAKIFPQLTRDDWLQFAARYARATVEAAMINLSKAPPAIGGK